MLATEISSEERTVETGQEAETVKTWAQYLRDTNLQTSPFGFMILILFLPPFAHGGEEEQKTRLHNPLVRVCPRPSH